MRGTKPAMLLLLAVGILCHAVPMSDETFQELSQLAEKNLPEQYPEDTVYERAFYTVERGTLWSTRKFTFGDDTIAIVGQRNPIVEDQSCIRYETGDTYLFFTGYMNRITFCRNEHGVPLSILASRSNIFTRRLIISRIRLSESLVPLSSAFSSSTRDGGKMLTEVHYGDAQYRIRGPIVGDRMNGIAEQRTPTVSINGLMDNGRFCGLVRVVDHVNQLWAFGNFDRIRSGRWVRGPLGHPAQEEIYYNEDGQPMHGWIPIGSPGG